MSYVRLALVLGLLAGSAASVAHAQSTLQPQCFFWEPPKTPGPIHPKFCPIARVFVNEEMESAASLAVGGVALTDTALPVGLGIGCIAPDYSVKTLRDYYVAKGWLAPGELCIFIQNIKTPSHRLSSLLGLDDFGASDPRTKEKIDVDVNGNGITDAIFRESDQAPDPIQQATLEKIRLRQPWLIAGQPIAKSFWTEFANALISNNVNADRLHLDIEPYSGRGRYSFPGNDEEGIDPLPGEYPYIDLALTDAFSKHDAYLLYALPLEDQGHKPIQVNGIWQLDPTASSFSINDNRWSKVPVPGFNGKTLKQLWQGDPTANPPIEGVNQFFNHRPYPLTAGINYSPNLPVADLRPLAYLAANSGNAESNHAAFIWYAQICQTALAAAHTTTAVNSMKTAFPNLKGGNYEMLTVTPGTQDFGWYQPNPGAGTSPVNFTRIGERGYKDAGNHGDNITSLSQGPDYDWLNYHELERVGDFSSPPLYAVGKNFRNCTTCPVNIDWLNYCQNDAYLPGYPLDDRWSASLRWHRWTLESMISSEGERNGGHPWMTVAPWIAPPGVNAAIFGDDIGPNGTNSNAYVVTSDDVNRQLGLLRSKAVPELLVFNPRRRLPGDECLIDLSASDGYAEFTKVYKQVYDPYLINFQIRDLGVETGDTPNCQGSSGTACPDARIERVSDTNPRFDSFGSPYETKQHTFSLSMTRSLTPVGTGQTSGGDLPTCVEVTAKVASSRAAIPADEMLRLTLELDAELTVPLPLSATTQNPISYVRIQWHEWAPGPNGTETSTLRWIDVGDGAVVNPSGPPTNFPYSYDIGFHAPIQTLTMPSGHAKWVSSMRRTFNLVLPKNCAANLVKADGTIKFRIWVKAENRNASNEISGSYFPPGASLNVKHDLVQVTRAPAYFDQLCSPGGDGQQQAMSQSGLLLFPGEQVGADINGSGEEDTTDLGIFLNALSEGQSLADVNFDEQIDGDDVEQFMTDYTDPQ